MDTVLLSFGVIFVAELGDKSQLLALALASRYRPVPILAGITIATTAVHGVSVLFGAGVAASVPPEVVGIVAGVVFYGFAVWTLRGATPTDRDQARVERAGRSAVVAATIAFVLAELGDKTMLATVTLATTHGALGTWVGSTAGMVTADAVAILVGRRLGARLAERATRIGAAVGFAAFGTLVIAEATL